MKQSFFFIPQFMLSKTFIINNFETTDIIHSNQNLFFINKNDLLNYYFINVKNQFHGVPICGCNQ